MAQKTPDERKAELDSSLIPSGELGWRIETRSEFQATVAVDPRGNIGYHERL
jgi:hypothetical protein